MNGFDVVVLIAGVFASLATIISCIEMYQQFRNYYKPHLQIWVIRILMMVPIYAVDSWLSLRFRNITVYINTVRDCYEGFVIYSFMNLLIGQLGGDSKTVERLRNKPPINCICPLCCWKVERDWRLVLSCKRGVLQFAIVKPVCALIAVILEIFDIYGDGHINWAKGYPYISIVLNISISIAMYYLILFYSAVSEFLKPFNPLGKFLAIKGVIFVSFWQGFTISILGSANVIHDLGSWERKEVIDGLQNFLICIEMFVWSIVHLYVFSYKVYKTEGESEKLHRPNMPLRDMVKTTLRFTDVLHDTKRTFGKTGVAELKKAAISEGESEDYDPDKNLLRGITQEEFDELHTQSTTSSFLRRDDPHTITTERTSAEEKKRENVAESYQNIEEP